MKISESEEMVMAVLWGGEPEDLDLETVTAKLKEKFGKTWKLQTVATFLTRLQKKGFVSIYKVGRYSHYHPEIKWEEYTVARLDEMVHVLFGGNAGRMRGFVEERLPVEEWR